MVQKGTKKKERKEGKKNMGQKFIAKEEQA